MTERMHSRQLAQPRRLERVVKGTLDRAHIDRLGGSMLGVAACRPARKQPDRIAMCDPVGTQQGERAGGSGT